VNWNGGVNPTAVGQIFGVPPGAFEVQVVLDTGGGPYYGNLQPDGQFGVSLSPPPALRPTSARLYLISEIDGDVLRQLVTASMPVVG
jgi:hypothetical protein